MPCFVFVGSLNKTNITYNENSNLPLKGSLSLWEHVPEGIHFKSYSPILQHVSLCILEHTLKHIWYLYSTLQRCQFVIRSKFQHKFHYLYWHFDAPAVFDSWFNKTKTSYIEMSILPFKVSLYFQEHTPKGTHFNKYSIILSDVSLFISQHTLKHIYYLYSVWQMLHIAIHSKRKPIFLYLYWIFWQSGFELTKIFWIRKKIVQRTISSQPQA